MKIRADFPANVTANTITVQMPVPSYTMRSVAALFCPFEFRQRETSTSVSDNWLKGCIMDKFVGQVLNWKLEQLDRQRILKKELGDWSGI